MEDWNWKDAGSEEQDIRSSDNTDDTLVYVRLWRLSAIHKHQGFPAGTNYHCHLLPWTWQFSFTTLSKGLSVLLGKKGLFERIDIRMNLLA